MFPDSTDDMIFTADVCGSQRRWDPLILRRRLIRAARGQLGKVMLAAAEPPAVDPKDIPTAPDELEAFEQAQAVARLASIEGQEQLTAVLREAFELPPLGVDAGVPEEIVCDVWAQWRQWLQKKKANGGTPPTCSPAADGDRRAAPSS